MLDTRITLGSHAGCLVFDSRAGHEKESRVIGPTQPRVDKSSYTTYNNLVTTSGGITRENKKI